MYANPITGENDPSITDRHITVSFRYASDDKHDPLVRGEIVDEINALAERLGCEVDLQVDINHHTHEEV